MSDQPVKLTPPPEGYADWLADLKTRIHTAQQRAALAVNRELVLLYWQIGQDILARQAAQGWGAKVIDRLSRDLRSAFPEMKGFSPGNLKYMRAFAEAWPEQEFVVQEVLAQLPWYHQLALLDKQPDLMNKLSNRLLGNCRGDASLVLIESPPQELATDLPSIAQIEQELSGRHGLPDESEE